MYIYIYIYFFRVHEVYKQAIRKKKPTPKKMSFVFKKKKEKTYIVAEDA